MKTYFYLQIKRILKILPLVCAVSVALVLSIAVILSSVVTTLNDDDKNQEFRIGITGDVDSDLVTLAISAFESSNSSDFSIKFEEMSEEDAKSELSKGELSAYIILPENFIENALAGKIDPVTYVTSAGATGIVTMVKNELTKVVTDIIVYSQKGTYGVGDALIDNGYGDLAYEYINEIALEYAQLALDRQQIYTIEELGKSNDLTTAEYLLCGLSVLFILLISLPFATIYTSKDYSFNKLMLSNGKTNFKMLFCEYFSHFVSMITIVLILSLLTALFSFALPQTMSDYINTDDITGFVITLIPVIVMVCAFNMMFFELSNNIVSTTLLHFLSALCLCYMGGCLYPISTFPVSVQKISAFLPTGIARKLLSSCFDASSSYLAVCGTLIYAVVFFFIALRVRNHKTANKRG